MKIRKQVNACSTTGSKNFSSYRLLLFLNKEKTHLNLVRLCTVCYF